MTMTGDRPLLLFTDLDGTLLNQDDYRYQAALPAIAALQARQIPLIPVTSKTRAEVAALRQELQLQDPFIVENGSAIFLEAADPHFACEATVTVDGYRCLRLGCTYTQARAGLHALGQTLNTPLQGFGDLSPGDLGALTGLTPAAATLAQTREFTEPFVTPAGILAPALERAAAQLGLQVTVGDRFSHLIGAGAGKGRAVQALVAAFSGDRPPATLGLGNSPNDLPMLAAVDQAIVIPGPQGPHPQLAHRGWAIAPAPAPEGWAAAVQAWLAKP